MLQEVPIDEYNPSTSLARPARPSPEAIAAGTGATDTAGETTTT